MRWLKALWRRYMVREILVAVPRGFDTPADGKLEGDPRFLREMAESMKKAPVVYENALSMLRQREARLREVPPETTEAERLAWKWRVERLTAEVGVLRTILYGPAHAAKALNELAQIKKAALTEEFSNWAAERTSP